MLLKVAEACTNATLVRTTAYHAEVDGQETYAGYAIAKGPITRALTRWLGIEQQFSPFLLKRVPREGFAPNATPEPIFPPMAEPMGMQIAGVMKDQV